MSETNLSEPAEQPESEPTTDGLLDGAGESIPTTERPEWLPQKFWSENGEADYEAMAKSYSELEVFVGKRSEDMEADVIAKLEKEVAEGLPEEPSGYAIPEMPEGINADNALMDSWKGYCHNNGLDQDGFNSGIEMFMQNGMSVGPSQEEEMGKLGDNAKARTEAVGFWVNKNFTPEEGKAIEQMATTADGVKALERMMESQKSNIGNNLDVASTRKTRKDLEEMMLDPRYSNPSQRDAAYVKQIDEAFSKMFG
jgi:hypothetical protein